MTVMTYLAHLNKRLDLDVPLVDQQAGKDCIQVDFVLKPEEEALV